jgi:hypothetical protein
LSSIESVDVSDVFDAAESLEADITSDVENYSQMSEIDSEITVDTSEVVAAADTMGGYAKEAQNSIQDFIAFIKTFEVDQFDTIYCEREWRSVQDFKFTLDDVAMIIAPKNLSGKDYFRALVGGTRQLNIPRKIPIVPWEDLVEN